VKILIISQGFRSENSKRAGHGKYWEHNEDYGAGTMFQILKWSSAIKQQLICPEVTLIICPITQAFFSCC